MFLAALALFNFFWHECACSQATSGRQGGKLYFDTTYRAINGGRLCRFAVRGAGARPAPQSQTLISHKYAGPWGRAAWLAANISGLAGLVSPSHRRCDVTLENNHHRFDISNLHRTRHDRRLNVNVISSKSMVCIFFLLCARRWRLMVAKRERRHFLPKCMSAEPPWR